MFRKTFYATHPGSVHGATNDDLRERYLIGELFADSEIRLNYLHYERFVIGGAAPIGEAVSLATQGEPACLRGSRRRGEAWTMGPFPATDLCQRRTEPGSTEAVGGVTPLDVECPAGRRCASSLSGAMRDHRTGSFSILKSSIANRFHTRRYYSSRRGVERRGAHHRPQCVRSKSSSRRRPPTEPTR